MSVSIWRRSPETPQTFSADVAIVGAGITGLSLAYWLTELRPSLKVIIIERSEVGAGASGRNAGFVTAGSTTYLANLIRNDGATKGLEHWEKKQESLRLMREHLFERFPAIESAAQGSVTCYRDSVQLAEVSALVSPHVKLEQISADELGAQGLKGFSGGLRLPSEGSLHPLKLLQALHQELVRRGVHFIVEQAASWLQDVTLVLERDKVKAPQVFLALNGYGGQFSELLGDLVLPKRAQMVALDGTDLGIRGNYYDPAQRVYFRRHRDGTLLVGGLRLLDEERENSDFDKVTQVIQEGLADYARQAFGARAVLARWCGIMGFTADEKPLTKTLAPGLTFVGGYSGHGMGMAFGHARSAVQSFLG